MKTKTLQIAITLVLSIGLIGLADAGGRSGGGGGGGSRGGGGGGFRIGGMGSRVKGPSSGQSVLRQLGGIVRSGGSSGSQSGGSASGKSSKGKLKISFHVGTLGTQRCYHAPVVVVSSPEVLFAPEPVPAEEIASGGTVELPGDWGREPGYACLMQGENYTYFKVLAWNEKGVKLEVPRLEIKEPIEAELLMVRFDRYVYPRIPVIVYPPLAQSATTAKTEVPAAADGQTATTKTEQAQPTPADAVPPDLNGEGTFEQLEKN
jgi:hypothetical protein